MEIDTNGNSRESMIIGVELSQDIEEVIQKKFNIPRQGMVCGGSFEENALLFYACVDTAYVDKIPAIREIFNSFGLKESDYAVDSSPNIHLCHAFQEISLNTNTKLHAFSKTLPEELARYQTSTLTVDDKEN
ncbi:MAG: hypothetical protein DI551_12530, partial [Micavibrio aeruginosavorus]